MDDPVDTILAQWEKERPDLDVSSMGIIGRIARFIRVQDKAIAETLREFALRPDEFDVLATLRRAGPPHRLNPKHLRETMMITSATVTHRLDKLEERKLVRRSNDTADRRSVVVQLTPRGKTLIDSAIEAHVATLDRLVGHLSRADRKELARLLKRLSQIPE